MAQSLNHAPVEWKELLCQLPSVLSAEFVFDDSGSVRELHVLSGMNRSAKQIVRDIQSAMMAQFGVELDHRIISVAQVPQDTEEALRDPCKNESRLICSGVDISIRSMDFSVTVELSLEGKLYVGQSSAGVSSLDRRRASAEAAVAAVSSFAGELCRLRLDDIRMYEIAGVQTLLSAVSFFSRGREELLVGSCLCRDDETLAAVRATLDALNRKISISNM